MIYLFYGKGKAKDVFKSLSKAALLEAKFGRLIKSLESINFSKN